MPSTLCRRAFEGVFLSFEVENSTPGLQGGAGENSNLVVEVNDITQGRGQVLRKVMFKNRHSTQTDDL
jgi:hypothetical protein